MNVKWKGTLSHFLKTSFLSHFVCIQVSTFAKSANKEQKICNFMQKFDADFESFLTDLNSALKFSMFKTLTKFVGKFVLLQ
jgi:hypothetical protein